MDTDSLTRVLALMYRKIQLEIYYARNSLVERKLAQLSVLGKAQDKTGFVAKSLHRSKASFWSDQSACFGSLHASIVCLSSCDERMT